MYNCILLVHVRQRHEGWQRCVCCQYCAGESNFFWIKSKQSWNPKSVRWKSKLGQKCVAVSTLSTKIFLVVILIPPYLWCLFHDLLILFILFAPKQGRLMRNRKTPEIFVKLLDTCSIFLSIWPSLEFESAVQKAILRRSVSTHDLRLDASENVWSWPGVWTISMY